MDKLKRNEYGFYKIPNVIPELAYGHDEYEMDFPNLNIYRNYDSLIKSEDKRNSEVALIENQNKDNVYLALKKGLLNNKVTTYERVLLYDILEAKKFVLRMEQDIEEGAEALEAHVKMNFQELGLTDLDLTRYYLDIINVYNREYYADVTKLYDDILGKYNIRNRYILSLLQLQMAEINYSYLANKAFKDEKVLQREEVKNRLKLIQLNRKVLTDLGKNSLVVDLIELNKSLKDIKSEMQYEYYNELSFGDMYASRLDVPKATFHRATYILLDETKEAFKRRQQKEGNRKKEEQSKRRDTIK